MSQKAQSPQSGEATLWHPRSEDAIVINERYQKDNPACALIQNVPKTLGNIVPDFLVGKHHAVVYMSLRFMRLHGNQLLESKLREVFQKYRLVVLLVLCDVEDVEKLLLDATSAAFRHQATLFPARSLQEAAQILEAFKSLENKNAVDYLLPKLDNLNPRDRAVEILATIPEVNVSDAKTLLLLFGSIRSALLATEEQLLACPGIGDRKARAIRRVVDCPFFLEET